MLRHIWFRFCRSGAIRTFEQTDKNKQLVRNWLESNASKSTFDCGPEICLVLLRRIVSYLESNDKIKKNWKQTYGLV